MLDPSIGRWLQMDPIEFDAGDVNLYRDVGNDPTNLRDPSGLEPIPAPPKDDSFVELQRYAKELQAWGATRGIKMPIPPRDDSPAEIQRYRAEIQKIIIHGFGVRKEEPTNPVIPGGDAQAGAKMIISYCSSAFQTPSPNGGNGVEDRRSRAETCASKIYQGALAKGFYGMGWNLLTAPFGSLNPLETFKDEFKKKTIDEMKNAVTNKEIEFYSFQASEGKNKANLTLMWARGSKDGKFVLLVTGQVCSDVLEGRLTQTGNIEQFAFLIRGTATYVTKPGFLGLSYEALEYNHEPIRWIIPN
jgi:hypothetical protein